MRRLRALPWKKIVLRGTLSAVLLVLVLFGLGYVLTDIPAANKVATDQITVVSTG